MLKLPKRKLTSLLQAMTTQTTSQASKQMLKALPARSVNARTQTCGNGTGNEILEIFPDSYFLIFLFLSQMEIGLKNVLSYLPEQRLVGDRRKYTTVPVTNGTLQASAQPLLLTHSSEQLSSPSLPGAPAFTPEPQGVAEPEPSHTKAREPLGQKERRDMECCRFGFSGSSVRCVPGNPIQTGMTARSADKHMDLIASNQPSLVTAFPFQLTDRMVSQN